MPPDRVVIQLTQEITLPTLAADPRIQTNRIRFASFHQKDVFSYLALLRAEIAAFHPFDSPDGSLRVNREGFMLSKAR